MGSAQGILPSNNYSNNFLIGKRAPLTTKSDERFDFAERCRSGKRPAFGFVQSNPFIDRFAEFGINCAFVAAVYAA